MILFITAIDSCVCQSAKQIFHSFLANNTDGWAERCTGTVGSSVFCNGDADGREGPFMLYSTPTAVDGAVPLYRQVSRAVSLVIFFFSHSFQKPLLLEIIIFRIANAHMIFSTLFMFFQVLKRSAQHLVCVHACMQMLQHVGECNGDSHW